MLTIIPTLDYEIHGNGTGNPRELMIEPTARLLNCLEGYGGKLTIFAEAAEIQRFKEHEEKTGVDSYHFQAIAKQLRDARHKGHDVQLHIHPSYANAHMADGAWQQDWSEYNLATLPTPRLKEILKESKAFLEALMRTEHPNYTVEAFRAGNWAAQPSRALMTALAEEGIYIESSVYKHGVRGHLVPLDYRHASHAMGPWRASFDDVCIEDPDSPVWEVPIYAESRRAYYFLNLMRLYRVYLSHRHPLAKGMPDPMTKTASGSPRRSLVTRLATKTKSLFMDKHAWKADYNQATARQLIAALDRAARAHPGENRPFVMIGHPKLFTGFNEANFRIFLNYVTAHPDRFRFGFYRDVVAQNGTKSESLRTGMMA